jgi:beta-lactamase regulating signal transducer with metallopeptidase domain/protocatechuate 3,4-dioxygenase beta subunit
MNGIFAVAMEHRQLDVAVAVCLLLSVALLLLRLVWQPAKRLWIIEWALVGGLLLAMGWITPWQRFSLGVLDANQVSSEATATSLQPDRPELLSMSRGADGAPFDKADKNVERSSATPGNAVDKSTKPNERDAKSAQVETPSVAATAAESSRWSRWILGAYALGASGMMLWLAAGQWTVHWLVRRAAQPSLELTHTWQQLHAEMQPAFGSQRCRNSRLLISVDLSHPVAVGIVRPAVLLPKWLVDSCTPEQLRPILAHEVAHVMRGDAAIRWLAAIFQVVFFYQPLYWWLRHELRLCQEYLADAQAAVFAPSTPQYAEQLVSLLKAAPVRSWRPLPGLGIIEGRSDLYRRIQMLVKAPRRLEFSGSRRWNWITATALLGFSLSLGLVTLRAADKKPQLGETVKVTEAAKPDVASKAVQPEFRFYVVNTQGKPVVGAKVQPWACSFVGTGGSAGLNEKLIPPTTTDAEGMVRIVFPTVGDNPQNRLLQNFVNSGIQSLALKVEHPDYPTWSDYIFVQDQKPIVLQDSATIEIRAHRDHEKAPLRRLYSALMASDFDWSEAGGLLTIRRVDLQSKKAARWLRIVHLPDTGPAWFSDLIDLKQHSGNPITIDATMKPGVRVEGRLAEQVPRPVKNGHVVGAIVSGADPSTNWYWSVAAEIAADGNFVIESMPADENLQIIAICDGWVSSSPTAAELHKYDTGIDPRAIDGTTVLPQLVQLKVPLVKPSIAMRPTATCEVTVLDEKNQPLANVTVAFSPNQLFYHSGSSIVGGGDDRLTRIREEIASGNHKLTDSANRRENAYTATTDKQGVAVVRNLPAGNEGEALAGMGTMFFVGRDGYITTGNVPNGDFGLIGAPLFAKLSAGKTTRLTAHMHKESEQQASLPDVAEDELAGRVVDEGGLPIEGVKVLVWERDDEKIRSDKDGQFRKKIETTHGDEKHLLVRLMKSGYAPYLVVDWRLGLRNQTVVMETKTFFEGTVRGPDGKPAANVLVRANQGPKEDNPAAVVGEIWSETKTDAEGRYKLLVQPDTYAFDVRAPGIGSARVPKDGEKGDNAAADSNLLPQPPRPKILIMPNEARRLDIKLESGIEFRAKVVDLITGKPVPKVRLWHWQYPGIEGRTNDEGLVTISSMPNGEFTFMIDPPAAYVQGWSNEIPDRWKKLIADLGRDGSSKVMIPLDQGLPFDLQPGMPEVTITLEPGVTISGRALDPNGIPVAGATVAPARSGKGFSLTGDTRYSVATKADGTFTVVLPPSAGSSAGSKYNLMVHDGTYQQWRKWANGIGPVLETKPGQKFDKVELKLTNPGTIRGRTVDERGKPVANVYVQTTSADRLENNYYNPATRSDKNGRFELRFVRSGRQLVHGWILVTDPAPSDAKFPVVDVKSGEATSMGDLCIPPQYQDH